HVGATRVGHGEVEAPILVHIPHRHGTGGAASGEVACGLDGAVAIAQQHTDVGAAAVGHGEVEDAVAVHIPHRHGSGEAAGIKGQRGEETGYDAALQALHEQRPEGTVNTTG